jgi:DNA-3-methyladenine glycosylase
MRRRRGQRAGADVSGLCRGPGNLTRALGITSAQNCLDLTGSPLRIEDRRLPKPAVEWSRRIGINVGVEREWRAAAAGSPAVSGRRRLTR